MNPRQNSKPDVRTRTALFLSPHLDDVAFSCGGTLARLARQGWTTHLATVFTASVPDPEGFALACQLDKGLGPEVDYMALRRAEDYVFAERIGAAHVHHLGLKEAPHRGYEAAPALFGGLRPGDNAWRDVQERLADLVTACAPDLLFAPQGIGGHVDHEHVVRAVVHLEPSVPICWYRDAPYVLHHPEARGSETLPADLRAVPVPIPDTLEAKLEATAAYTSQLGFQFGGDAAMRAALTTLAREEGARVGRLETVEVLAVETEDEAFFFRHLTRSGGACAKGA